MLGIQVANTRLDPQVPLNPAKYPNSMRPPESAKLSLDVLLKGYTLSSAGQSHWETIMGTLEEGKLANLCVLSDNPFEVRPGEIGKIRFETVIFEGEVIHGKL